ncbi:MAG: energy transducer TonB [Acidobacteriales bacterium]|nr:energy transducer TonB [Terriglobales bacterium]
MLTRVHSLLRALLMLALLISTAAYAAADSSNRKLKSKVAPAYPELAKKLGITGLVRLELLVASDGTVKTVTVKGGNPVLAEAAERALHKWRYAPGEQETIPVEVNFRPEQ